MQVDQLVSRYLAMDLPEHSARQRFFTHSIAPLQLLYQRRRPERSVAYQVVQQNLETWLALRSADWCELPIPDWRQCAFSGCYAHQISANTEQMGSLTKS